MATRPATQQNLDLGQRVFTNLAYLYFTPWKEDGSEPDSTTYDLSSIVGDTTSVEQNDNEVNEIAHEFSKEPLYENVTLGTRTFTAECVDFQETILEKLCGWTSEDGATFAADDYRDLFCMIEIGFNSTEDIVVLPKVKLNSKAVLSSMKTDASRATITGTCYSAYVKVGEAEHKSDMVAIESANKTSYSVSAAASS